MSIDHGALLDMAADVLIKSYRQPAFVMARGKGCELWDTAGKRYLDMTAGISVCCLGHGHPALTKAVAEQADRLIHVSNLFFIEQQILAAKNIVDRSFADRVFFCNSGAEANEAAIKLARRYHHVIEGEPRDLVISTQGSFHGRTIGTVSITGQDKYREGFGPLFGPVEFVPFGDASAATAALASRKACAFIVEPIQAEGGILVPPAGYLQALRKACDDTGTLLIFDEVQTGMGRTGMWFGYQHDDVAPDVMSLAKALGGGVAIGAVAASERAAEGLAFIEGSAVPHASTFGGNALACAAANAVFEVIESEGLLANTVAVGDYLGERLTELAERHSSLCEGTRGRGLLRGLVMRGPAGPTFVACREKGVLLSVAGGTVVRFAPALNVQRSHIDEAIKCLDAVLATQEATDA